MISTWAKACPRSDREGGSGERGEERAEGSVDVPGHPLSALLVLSTEVGGISATKLLIMVAVVNSTPREVLM